MKKLSEKVLYEGQWLAVHQTVYRTKHGLQLTWETVHRRRSTVGVVVVARLMPSGRFILIKQYRPAIDGYIISFPAGLGQNDPNHALVELKEETGYTGTIKVVSPVVKTGSSMINDNARIVYVEVDEYAPANQNPVQTLEDAEDIEVCLVAKDDAENFLLKQIEQGISVSANLWYVFGMGQWIV
ncbi:MAG: NUDIX hydrolase [Candidatus Omnitrophica bacterium]|nr:NUDIX hydrolase [Candidatus Omnitrophota bacterium]MDE2213887.1 NUDIX hydrolase [Candidatus Omnitrophota bacterium]